MILWLVDLLLLSGGVLALIAAIGILRMPDLFTRMHATSKSSTLGVGLILLAVVFYFGSLDIALRALLVIGFMLLTAPIAAHVIARAAYARRVSMWRGSVIDELDGNYDR